MFVVEFWREGVTGADYRAFDTRGEALRKQKELQAIARRKRKPGQVFAVEGVIKEVKGSTFPRL